MDDAMAVHPLPFRKQGTPDPLALREPGTPDESLVDRVLTGDVQAFELLMRRNNQRLYRAIRSLVPDEDEVEEEPPMNATPEQGLARAQLNHLLELLVDELPESHRTVFVLREVQQLSTAEVAEALGLSADNVKQRLSRAKATLRNALEQRTGATLAELCPFEAPRCDRVVAGVLARLPDHH